VARSIVRCACGSRHSATHCNALQRTATYCNTLQHIVATATHCNTLQHTATHCNTWSGVNGHLRAAARLLGAGRRRALHGALPLRIHSVPTCAVRTQVECIYIKETRNTCQNFLYTDQKMPVYIRKWIHSVPIRAIRAQVVYE